MLRPRYRLEIEDAGADTPVIIRLRHLLKGLLRSLRFRCLWIEPTTTHDGEDEESMIHHDP